MTPVPIAMALLVGALLAGCGEKPQTLGTKRGDVSPSAGTTGTHTAAGWKAGDAASWESQLKVRSQSQNEYTRVPAR